MLARRVRVSEVTLVAEPQRVLRHPLPADVVPYEVAGPLFLGAVRKGPSAPQTVQHGASDRSTSAREAT